MTRVCPRCGRPLAGRDRSALDHAANVRKLVAWAVAFPFTLGAAMALGAAAGIRALR